jgi:hypothetical protein
MKENLLMQHALILNRLIPETGLDGRVEQISAVTHDGRSVRFESEPEQRINATTLQFQQTPLLILTDQLLEPFPGMLQVPPQALIAVVPMASADIAALLDRQEGDRLLEAVSAQLC